MKLINLATVWLQLSLVQIQCRDEGQQSETTDTSKKISNHSNEITTKMKNEKSSQTNPPKPSTIYNGEIAGKYEFPYIVAISNVTLETYLYAAGVIINSKWIITAKHVARNGYLGDGIVVTPKYDNERTNLKEKLKYLVIDYFCPQHSVFADIALMKLKKELPLERGPTKFKKIRLIQANHRLHTNEIVTVAGWGFVNATKGPGPISGTVSNDLRKADIKVRPEGECAPYDRFSSPEKFCSSGDSKGVCYGDSGGPVVIRGESPSKDILVGIVTGGGKRCL
ncbi:kallikrein-4-like [Brevipalpus obovatus]|uniref:kallikrein-4-like n=1 Tax=Brevipalpus obovatus TaxID=246614 RepID=UPI003D9DC6A4